MAGDTIEQVVVKFIADNTSYLRDIKNMQAEMHKYGVLTSNTLEKIDQKLGKTSKSYKQASTSAQQFHKTGSSGAMAMFQHYTNLGAQLGFLVRQYVSLYAAVRTVTTVMKEGLDFNKFKEETTVAFTVMMRSADAAKAKMEEFYDFAVKSPMTFQETAKGARQLMAYGFQAEELVGTMKMLGTVGKAVGASMDDMAYVYGTLRAQGRAYSRDLLQFGMRGIPIYEELAKVMDVNVSKIQKLASEGQIGFKQVEKAFRNMTNEGGRFGGILDAWMQTFAGKSSMLADIWQKNLGAMTEGTLAIFKDIVDRLIIALDTPEAAETFANIGKSIAGLIELLITLVDIFDKFKVLIIGMTGFKLLTKVTMSLMTMFTGMPGKLVGMAQGLYALKGASALASTSVATLGGGIEVLSSAIAATSFLPIMGGLALLGAEAFRIVKKVRELKEEFAENMQDPTFSYNQMRANLYNQLLSGPESAGGMIYAKDYTAENIFNKKTVEEKNAKLLTDYQNIIKNYVAKYKVTAIEVVKEMQAMGAITGQLEKMLVWWATRIEQLPKVAAEKLKDAEIPDLANWLASRTGVDVSAIVDPIKTQIEALNGEEGYEFVSSYDVLAKRAASMYVTSFNERMKTEEGLAKAVGSEWGLDQNIAQVKKRIEEFSTLYMDFSEKVDFAGSASDEFLTEEITKWVAKLNKLEKEKKALEEATKAREKYNEEIRKMTDDIDKYNVLGFNPTKIQELDYEYNKFMQDMEKGRGIWEFITDPGERADYAGLFWEFIKYQKDQIEETQAFELANAKLSKELEYQVALMEGQAFYANQELAMFDAQLESQKQILQLTIARGGEGVDAAKQELEWVIKIGRVQRENLERELALTRAKMFLTGETASSQAYWNKVELSLASLLGIPQYEKGTGYVPNTGPAILHKGEAVIPAEYMNYLRTGGEKYPFPTRGMQETIDSIINKFIFFGWYKDKNDFINKRQRQIKAGTWKQASALKTEEQFLFSTPEADYYFDPDASTTGTAQAITMGRNIIINPFSTGYQGQDIVNHELGHVRSFNLFGASNMEKLAKKDVYFSLLDKAREANATYLKIYKEYLSRILGGETGLAIDSFFQDKLRPAYDTALQLFRDYQNTDIEVIANWLGGVYGSFPNESNWEDVLGFYANGTGGAKRGPAIVGEKGPELVYMKGGETVIPNHMLNGYAKGAGVPGYNPVDYGNEEMRMAIEEMKRQVDVAVELGKIFKLLSKEGSELARVIADPTTALPIMANAIGTSIAEFEGLSKIINMATNPFSTIATTILEVGASLLDFGAVIESENEYLLFSIEKSMGKLKSEVEYYTDQLNTIIDKNLKSQKDLYELGLITATQYEAQVTAANAQRPSTGDIIPPVVDPEDLASTIASTQAQIDAAKKEADLVKTRAKFLELLQNAPWWATTLRQGRGPVEVASDLETLAGYAQKLSEGNILYTGILGINEGKIIGNTMKQFIESLAVGTPFVPSDMVANIHRGEMIVPRTFSDSIRNGELVLSGNDNLSGQAVYNISINVEGSVLKENDLASTISTAIRRGTKRGFVV